MICLVAAVVFCALAAPAAAADRSPAAATVVGAEPAAPHALRGAVAYVLMFRSALSVWFGAGPYGGGADNGTTSDPKLTQVVNNPPTVVITDLARHPTKYFDTWNRD